MKEDHSFYGMILNLSNEKKQELEKQHKSTRDKREGDRIKAILLTSEGWTASMISQALRIHETTVLRHVADYEESEKLKPANGGSSSHLGKEETKELIAQLKSFVYHHTHEIVAFVKTRFGLNYSVSGMNHWLHQHGFSYKKPKGIPHKFDPIRQ